MFLIHEEQCGKVEVVCDWGNITSSRKAETRATAESGSGFTRIRTWRLPSESYMIRVMAGTRQHRESRVYTRICWGHVGVVHCEMDILGEEWCLESHSTKCLGFRRRTAQG